MSQACCRPTASVRSDHPVRLTDHMVEFWQKMPISVNRNLEQDRRKILIPGRSFTAHSELFH